MGDAGCDASKWKQNVATGLQFELARKQNIDKMIQLIVFKY